jgi:hemolysin activation/secretion protein
MRLLVLLFLLPWMAWSGAIAQPAAGASPTFDLLEFEIEGNTVLAVPQVEQAVMPFLGPGRTLAEVEKAREALEKAYQGAGFLSVFVDIPEQRIDGGVVRLRVVEGRVDRLAVTGSRYYDQGFIRQGVPALAPGTVPDFNALQTQIGALSREQRQLQPVLKPGRTPGTLDAEIKVSDQLPLQTTVELNNRHAADTDPWRLQGNLRYDNLFQRDHSIGITAIVAPFAVEQSQVLALNYSAPLTPDWTALGYVVWSDSEVEPLGVATVFGKGLTIGTRAVVQLGDVRQHQLSFGVDYKDLRERTVAGTDELSTPLRYLPFQLAYTGNWAEGRALTTFTSSWTFAIRSILQRDIDCPGTIGPVDQFACKREGGDGSFGYWRADLRHTRPLADLAGLAGLAGLGGLPGSVALRLGWQLAGQPLVPAEQFIAGGADTVRGYLEAEGSGDEGVLGAVEWRSANLWPAFSEGAAAARIDDLSLLAFVDAARLRIREPSVGQDARFTLAGTGFGLRLRALKQLTADVDLAWPLRSTAESPSGEPRLHVRFSAAF